MNGLGMLKHTGHLIKASGNATTTMGKMCQTTNLNKYEEKNGAFNIPVIHITLEHLNQLHRSMAQSICRSNCSQNGGQHKQKKTRFRFSFDLNFFLCFFFFK